VPTSEALQAIDEHYAAFATARKPLLRSNEPWRPDAEWIGRQPLRDLPAGVIREFAFELGSTIGDAEDVRYLVPRLLELLLRDELVAVLDPPIMMAIILRRAAWTGWPEREREAIRAFLEAYLEQCLGACQVATVLDLVTSLAMLFDDLAPWLGRIRGHRDVAGLLTLLRLAEAEGSRLLRKEVRPTPFLEGREAQEDQLLAWLREPASFAQLDAVRAAVGPVGPDGKDLGWAYEGAAYWLHACGGRS